MLSALATCPSLGTFYLLLTEGVQLGIGVAGLYMVFSLLEVSACV